LQARAAASAQTASGLPESVEDICRVLQGGIRNMIAASHWQPADVFRHVLSHFRNVIARGESQASMQAHCSSRHAAGTVAAADFMAAVEGGLFEEVASAVIRAEDADELARGFASVLDQGAVDTATFAAAVAFTAVDVRQAVLAVRWRVSDAVAGTGVSPSEAKVWVSRWHDGIATLASGSVQPQQLGQGGGARPPLSAAAAGGTTLLLSVSDVQNALRMLGLLAAPDAGRGFGATAIGSGIDARVIHRHLRAAASKTYEASLAGLARFLHAATADMLAPVFQAIGLAPLPEPAGADAAAAAALPGAGSGTDMERAVAERRMMTGGGTQPQQQQERTPLAARQQLVAAAATPHAGQQQPQPQHAPSLFDRFLEKVGIHPSGSSGTATPIPAVGAGAGVAGQQQGLDPSLRSRPVSRFAPNAPPLQQQQGVDPGGGLLRPQSAAYVPRPSIAVSASPTAAGGAGGGGASGSTPLPPIVELRVSRSASQEAECRSAGFLALPGDLSAGASVHPVRLWASRMPPAGRGAAATPLAAVAALPHAVPAAVRSALTRDRGFSELAVLPLGAELLVRRCVRGVNLGQGVAGACVGST
jgi:hypothetical protein